MTTFNHVPIELPDLKTKTIDKKRFYITPDGDFPSITTVLSIRKKEGLWEWRKRVGNDVANYVARTAAARGTSIHHMCDDYLNNMQTSQPDEWEKHKKKFLHYALFRVLRDKGLCNIGDIYAQEAGLYSTKYKVAGRVDCIANYKGELSVIDFKTSTRERNDEWNENYYIQCSAYAEMFQELSEREINQIVILVVTEDGTVQEFIKDKSDYTPLLVDALSEWRKINENVSDKTSWSADNLAAGVA